MTRDRSFSVSNVLEIPVLRARTDPEEMSRGGTGLVVLGLPPLFSTVSFNEKNTASAIPLSEGLVISQRFEKFYLQHPYADGGLFRLVVLQGDDWIERPLPPEPLRFSATLSPWPTVINENLQFQVRNNVAGAPSSDAAYAPLIQRMVRVTKIIVCSGRPVDPPPSARQVQLRIAYPGEPLTAPWNLYNAFDQIAADSRVNVTDFSAGKFEFSDANPVPLAAAHALATHTFDPLRAPELLMDVDVVLSPGGRMECVIVGSPLSENYACTFCWSERPFN